ncbi:MAG: leucine-rich repeat protein [Acutalibacteraceae bacterium]
MKKAKKTVSLILTLLIAASVFSAFPISASALSENGYEYEVYYEYDDSGNQYPYAAISSYTGTDTVINIPETLGGYSVKEILGSAFMNTEITSVNIPATVAYLDPSAFFDCVKMTSLTVSADSKYLCSVDNAVYSKDMHSLILYPQSKDTKDFVIPDSVGEVSCSFAFCSLLETITVPAGVEYFPAHSLYGCANLREINVSIDNEYFSSENGILFDKEGREILRYPQAKADASYTIPDGVEGIGSRAFSECQTIESVTIPDSIVSIGEFAFYACNNLNEIVFPSYLTYIGSYAFEETGWKDNLPDGVVYAGNVAYEYKGFSEQPIDLELTEGTTLICDSAFEALSFIQSVTIPESMESIGYFAFSECTGLTSVTFNAIDCALDASSFYGCSALTGVTFGGSVASVPDYAFSDCAALSQITVPDSVTRIGKNAFGNTAWYSAQPDGIVYAGKVAYTIKGDYSSVTDAAVNDGTVTIGDSLFEGYAISSVSLPDSVRYIGDNAFAECVNLGSITLPSGLETIGSGAFSGCTGLTAVDFPPTVTEIGFGAFSDCTEITEITVPGSVVSIGDSAFSYCTGLRSVTVSDGVVNISASAFRGCTGLESVVIPDSVESIGESAFYGCIALKNITIPKSVTSISEYALGYYYDYDIDQWSKVDGFTVSGYVGTAAKQYADDNGFNFETLPTTVYGDLNGDGEVNLNDAITAMKSGIELIELDEQSIINADMDKDGKVGLFDAITIQRLAVMSGTY